MDKRFYTYLLWRGKGENHRSDRTGDTGSKSGEKRYHYTVHEGKKCRSNWFCAASGAGD